MAKLGSDFYLQPTLQLAKQLLGCKLVVAVRENSKKSQKLLCSGIIVETEAYLDRDDPACHASRGMTPRNRTMFGPPGHLYVYMIHSRFCANIVSEQPGRGAAVLIRALQPTSGLEYMDRLRPLPRQRDARKLISHPELSNGPGKLCQALGIDISFNGLSLVTSKKIWLERVDTEPFSVIATPRIGISQGRDLLYRFFVDGNRYVSGKASDHSNGRRHELACRK